MKGYIGLTTKEWLNNIRKHCELNEVVFWCKKKSFKAIESGEPFFFLKRDRFTSNMERYLVGHALYSRFERTDSENAWKTYGSSLGFESEEDFNNTLEGLYREKSFELGCIVLQTPVFYETEVSLGVCGIDYSPCIVSGKIITGEECLKIEDALRRMSK